MKHLIQLLIFCLLLQVLPAQNNLDILTVSARYTSPSAYDSVMSVNAQETGSFIGLTIPFSIRKKTIIYNSLNYFYFHVNNETEIDNSLADPINLHAFIFRTGIIQQLGNGNNLQLLFAPRYMTDNKGNSSEKFQLGGLAMYEKVFNERLTIGFGAMYNQEEFGPYLVPLINLNWKPSGYFSITGLLPVYGKINFHINEKLTTGISHFGLTTTFPLEGDEYKDDYIERQSIDLSLFGKYNLISNLYVEVRLGRTLTRSYRQYGPGDKIDFAIPLVTFGDDRNPKNIEFKDSFLAEIRLIYSIPIPKD